MVHPSMFYLCLSFPPFLFPSVIFCSYFLSLVRYKDVWPYKYIWEYKKSPIMTQTAFKYFKNGRSPVANVNVQRFIVQSRCVWIIVWITMEYNLN